MASEVKRTVNLEYQADLKQLIAQLEKMPGITAQEAKKMVSVLDSNFRKAEKAAKKSQEASKKAAKEAQRAFKEVDAREAEQSLEAVSDASGEVDSTLSAMSGTLGTIGPEFGELAGFVGDAAAAIEAVTALGGNVAKMVAPVVAAVLTLSAVYHELAGRVEEAEERIASSREALEEMQASVAGFRDRIRTKQLELEVALGNERVEALDEQKALLEAQALTGDQISRIEQERAELLSQANMLQSQFNHLAEKNKNLSDARLSDALEMRDINVELQPLLVRSNALGAQYNKLKQDEREIADQILQVAEKQKKEAEDQAKLEQQRKAAAEFMRREEERKLAVLQAQTEVQEILVNANKDLFSDTEKALNIADEQLDKLQEIEDTTGSTLELETARASVIQRLNRDLKAIEAKELQEANEQLASVVDFMEEIPSAAENLETALEDMASKLQATFLNLALAIAAPFQEIFQATMSLSTELMGLTLDRLSLAQNEVTEINDQIAKAGSKSQVDALKEERRIALEAIKDQKARATEQFKLNKSLRIAEAIMGTASAAAQALASPPGPPSTIPLAALTAALGAVQIARIANEQPSFHQGGMVTGLQPDERSAVLRTGEGVLTAQGVAAAGGPQGVNALNQGSAGGQPLTVVFTASNRVMDGAVYNAMRSGAQLRSVTRDLRPRGRRNIYRQQARV